MTTWLQLQYIFMKTPTGIIDSLALHSYTKIAA